MTDTTSANDKPDDAAQVAEYLRSHPDFFTHHANLLDHLQIEHGQTGAVSLIERQISGLRSQNEQQQSRLDTLLEIAHQNDRLNTRVHQLTLDLIRCRGEQALFEALEQGLAERFQVGQLVCMPLEAEQLESSPFLADLIERGEPRCGRFTLEQRVTLFGERADQVHSAILVPLVGEGVTGLFALADEDPHRYHPGMATDYLARLGEVVSCLLSRERQHKDDE